MDLSRTPIPTAGQAAGLILALALLTTLAPPLAWRPSENPAPPLLGCHLQPGPQGPQAVLSNQAAWPLEPGTRFAWAERGTPAPLGSQGVLGQRLMPGQQLALPSTAALHGAGCIATVLR